jgi:sulfur carrier protein ThiS
MMEYKVQLLSYLEQVLPKSKGGNMAVIHSETPLTAGDIFEQLNIADDLANTCLISVNGTVVPRIYVLSESDVIAIMPIHYGG